MTENITSMFAVAMCTCTPVTNIPICSYFHFFLASANSLTVNSYKIYLKIISVTNPPCSLGNGNSGGCVFFLLCLCLYFNWLYWFWLLPSLQLSNWFVFQCIGAFYLLIGQSPSRMVHNESHSSSHFIYNLLTQHRWIDGEWHCCTSYPETVVSINILKYWHH